MNGMEALAGDRLLSIGFLVVMLVSIVTSRLSSASLSLLLGAAVMLLGAQTMYLAAVSSAQRTPLELSAIRTVQTGLEFGTGLAFLASWLAWRPPRRLAYRCVSLLAALLPLWLDGLYWYNTRQRGGFPIAMTLALTVAWAIHQQEAAEAQIHRERELELGQAVLAQEQMRPHFIFNSLSSIQTACRADPELAVCGLENLSAFLRRNMDALTEHEPVPFQRELEHTRQYVALEQLNPQAAFRVSYELGIEDFSLPPLTVQPLVENAIQHGLRFRPDGQVTVRTQIYGETVRIEVEDNGPGFPQGTPVEKQERLSRGLDSIRTRLETQCGGTMRVHTGAQGTRIVLLLPRIKCEMEKT